MVQKSIQKKESGEEGDLEVLISILPSKIQNYINVHEDKDSLVEVILDLGRPAEVRFFNSQEIINDGDITHVDLQSLISRVGDFGDDNRAGIERTLHRISVIRNRKGAPVGITCRVGRAIEGTIKNIEDLVNSGESVLLLGRPGVGKTTMLREVARVLSESANKRVVIVDTSNEIAGDGDVPHVGIGRSRRMQVPATSLQHRIMIEAVENHMPEVIIIDEMSTESESLAARTIAERGVQLIATAHANNLENVLTNPTLSDLVGGTQTVTLGDIEAKRRNTQKTILERKHDPTFPIVVEIVDRNTVSVHKDSGKNVDNILRGKSVQGEMRWIEDGKVKIKKPKPIKEISERKDTPKIALFAFGVSKAPLKSLIKECGASLKVTDDESEAKIFLTTKSHYSKRPKSLEKAQNLGINVHVLRKNSKDQVKKFVEKYIPDPINKVSQFGVSSNPFSNNSSISRALEEIEFALIKISNGEKRIELTAQNSFVRRLQHKAAAKEGISSLSVGEGASRRVVLEKVW